MWDSHFRVGGAKGSDLQISDCPAAATSINTDCMAASLLMHITSSASGYFENVWAWVADHDLDDPRNAATTEGSDGIPVNVFTQISIYVGRGILIESQGPTWLYGTASEHCQMYQYQLVGASNVYLGHMQTETPLQGKCISLSLGSNFHRLLERSMSRRMGTSGSQLLRCFHILSWLLLILSKQRTWMCWRKQMSIRSD
jgi:hypothetical protein